jgi:hypothetical protein
MVHSRSLGCHAKHVAWRRVGDEVVLLDLETSTYYSLNQTAGQVWELIGKGFSEEAILEEIAEAYQKDMKIVRRDVSALIDRLRKENLISVDNF